MNQVTVRVATSDDLIDLAEMWYENRVIQQQSDARVTLVSGAKTRWIAEAALWLSDAHCSIWVGMRGNTLSGYLIAWLQDMPPGVHPNRVGCITDMAVDPHIPSGGATQALLNAARAWVKECGVENLIVTVPHRQPVQQAFWRGQGARTWMDLMWLKL